MKPLSLDEALGILMSGFLRGGVGFLKGTGEIIKGSSGVNREVRVGVTHVSYLHFLANKASALSVIHVLGLRRFRTNTRRTVVRNKH